MKKFIKENRYKIIGVLILIVVIALVYFESLKKPTVEESIKQTPQEQTGTQQAKTDFFNKYTLYYFNNDTGSYMKNGEKIDTGGDNFTPNILFADGNLLSSYNGILDKTANGISIEDAVNSSLSQNDYKLYFNGNTYDSNTDNDSTLRDKNFIYYTKCLKVEYHKSSNRNRCVKTALYSNNDKIDEADLTTDVEISVGISNIEPLFTKNGILYYIKAIGDKYYFYSYNPTSKKMSLYSPELFSNTDNELLGILDNGDIIFDNSNGIFKNNLQSKIIDQTQLGEMLFKGGAFGDSYYYFNTKFNQQNNDGGYGLFKDNLLISKIHSNVYGKIINADERDCHFGNFIHTAYTPMYCINKTGTIVRLDSKTKRDKNDTRGTITEVDSDIIYAINNDVVDFSNYWYWGINSEKIINSVSFIFDEKGNVSNLVVDATDKQYLKNIYLVSYLGGGKLGEPQILASNASLFGVVKK